MYSPATGRFLTKDSWQGDYNKPLSLNRWNYTDGNPVNSVDPSGHTPVDGNRANQMKSDAIELQHNENYNAFERFRMFMANGVSLYRESEIDQFMVDITAVIHGYEYDTDYIGNCSNPIMGNSPHCFWPHFNDHHSVYWAGGNAFEHPNNIALGCKLPEDHEPSPCGQGWNIKYNDGTDQSIHFWFYVAVTYFDGPTWAFVGNWFHEKGPAARGQSQQDYDLGLAGRSLGIVLRLQRSFIDRLGLCAELQDPSLIKVPGMSLKQIPYWMDAVISSRGFK